MFLTIKNFFAFKVCYIYKFATYNANLFGPNYSSNYNSFQRPLGLFPSVYFTFKNKDKISAHNLDLNGQNYNW